MLKVVVSIEGGRAAIGVQQPSSDPHIETFDDHDLCPRWRRRSRQREQEEKGE